VGGDDGLVPWRLSADKKKMNISKNIQNRVRERGFGFSLGARRPRAAG
jgi:hypothetical protein